jgi:hypothetical protein
MGVDMFESHDKIGNVAARRGSWLRAAREVGDPRYYLVVVYVTPAAPYIHLAAYYAVNEAAVAEAPHFARLWDAFTAHGPAADAFRNDRWKVIPRIAEGSWVVQKAVGAKPALLAQKLTHTWIINDGVTDDDGGHGAGGEGGAGSRASRGAGSAGGAAPPSPVQRSATTTSLGCDANLHHHAPSRTRGGSVVSTTGPGPYLESDCDVASSSMAFVLVSLLQQYAKYIVIDLGFAIEPRSDEECPEAVLGSVRLSRMDVTRPPTVAAEPGDMVLGAAGVTHGSAPPAGAAASAIGEGDGEGEGEEEDEE